MTKVTEELSEGTKAKASIQTHTASLADMISKMQGMGSNDITKLKEVIDQIGHEGDAISDGQAASNKATISTKTLKEDLSKIFGKDNEELSEDFLDEMAVLFESAIQIQVAAIQEDLYVEAQEVLEELVEAKTTEIMEGLDLYLEEAVSEWLVENEIAIESSLQLEQMGSFLDGLRDLFEAHDIEIPEDKLDLVEALADENEELQEKVNTYANRALELEALVEAAEKESIIEDLAEGMVMTDSEKFKTLVENLEFADMDDFAKKATLVKNTHFKKGEVVTEEAKILGEEVNVKAENGPKVIDDAMSKYSSAISKDVKKS